IEAYVASQPAAKAKDMRELHALIQALKPGCKLWFLEGTDEKGKIVSNPNIGYGFQIIKYKDGKTREFYQVGLSANTTGISVYILGIDDKKYLAKTYGAKIGKASVTGYCIKFKTLKDVNIETLKAAILDGIDTSHQN